MSSAPIPVKAATVTAVELVLLTAAIWVLRGYVWPTLSNVEVATLQARLDPRLFAPDFSVQESLRFSPRFYYNELILLPARAGLPLAWAFAGWHLVALATLLRSARSLGQTLGLGAFASATLITWLLTVGIGTLGGVYFYTHAPVPAVWAGAAVMAGAAEAVRGRTTAAFAWCGAAALLQFLVGFYAGVLALPLLFRASARTRITALGGWGLGLALVFVPLWLSGGTATGLLNDPAFVKIYARLRLPHHLVPSAWGWAAWVQAVAFYGGAWWFLARTSAGRPTFERRLLHATLAIAAGALVLNYVFIELHPLALVAQLQPARITPLSQGIVLVLLATRVQERAARGDWLGAVLLTLIPWTLFPGMLLALAAVLPPRPAGSAQLPWTSLALMLAVLLAFQPFDPSLAARGVRYTLWAAIVAVQLVAGWLGRRTPALVLAAGLAVVGAGLAARASLQPDWPRFLALRFAPDALPTDTPGRLGRRFGLYAPVDALVLLPPAGGTWSFKLYAQRGAVVDDKNSPFTDRGLREWKARMDAVLGAPFETISDPVAAWAARTPGELRATARRYGAHYVLTRDEWHPAGLGTRLEQEQGWSLWRLPAAAVK
jgi:hypothetical protein